MTQVEYDCAMEDIHCRREEEILPIQKAIAALEEKIARCKKEMAELELKRQTLGHEKTLVVARLQEVKAKYHNERKNCLKTHVQRVLTNKTRRKWTKSLQ